VSGFLQQLRKRAAARPRRIAFPEAGDPRTLEAVAALQRERLVVPVLIGEPPVRELLAHHGGDGDAIELISPLGSGHRDALVEHLLQRRAGKLNRVQAEAALHDPMFFAAALVALGHVDGCVGGAARATADVIRAALWCIGTEEGIRTISSSFYMVVRPFRGTEAEVLTFTDGGVVPQPSAEQLAEIAEAAVNARRRIAGDEPRVAFLSYSTTGSAEGPDVERVREAFHRFRERNPDVVAEGEVQADAALIPEVALRKSPASQLAGTANVLVFPDLDAGNIGYKLVQRLAGAEAIGPILQGVARPCNDLSRGATAADIVNVACVTALQAR
jgi:phosphate acetyltransferase